MVEGIKSRFYGEAKEYIAGGVNSPVRSFKAVGCEPVFINSGRGSKIYAERHGREFIDYCMGWGSLILGHARADVVDAIKEALDSGVNFGAPTIQETELAKLIQEAMPSIDRVRFTNSGTEAVMGAVRLARAYTKKDDIIRFKDSYHGHADYLLECPGIPDDFKKHTLTTPYNDLDAVEELAKRRGKTVAAIIVEPVAANAGVVLPQEGFLKSLRKVADRYNIVLIFDEVITGFRLSYGGAQEYFNVKPDLTSLGKIAGGGLPFGAFGGKGDIMKLLSPEGNVYQAGTFSGNPVTVASGIATLKALKRADLYKALERTTKRLCRGIEEMARRHAIKLKVANIASIFGVSFEDRKAFKKFFHSLLKKGVYLSPSEREANFLSCAHTIADIDRTLEAIDAAFKNLRRSGS